MATPALPARTRIDSVDLLRGLVMVIMALDHTRDFLGIPGLNPVNLATTTVPLFFTRWITHICAPTFFLLAGTGARLAVRRRSRAQLSRFLFTRGLWLIFLELVLLRGFAWQFNFDYRLTMLTILWGIGWAMIVTSAAIFLPDSVVAVLAVAIIVTHNLTDSIAPSAFGRFAPLWNILHVLGRIIQTPRHQVFVAYALIPWIAVTPLGYVLGRIYSWDQPRRRRFLFRIGFILACAFILLRSINHYGDPLPWTRQKTAIFTLLSFLNTNKYPPSLLFLLMTLGPALILLAAFERPSPHPTPSWLRPLLVYGRVPLLYFALHALLLHLIALAICAFRYHHTYWVFQSPTPSDYPFTPPPQWGLRLPALYLCWILVVFALYPICKWFSDLRRRRNDPWLSYL